MIKTNLINQLEKAMNGSALRHSVLANNISNVNTPGYKRSDVSFRATLDETLETELQLKTTNSAHLKTAETKIAPKVITFSETSLRNDGNNVDVDMELATLAENNLYFNSLAQFLSSQLSILRQSISEGRR